MGAHRTQSHSDTEMADSVSSQGSFTPAILKRFDQPDEVRLFEKGGSRSFTLAACRSAAQLMSPAGAGRNMLVRKSASAAAQWSIWVMSSAARLRQLSTTAACSSY
jgi:hypothetical protein